MRIVLSNALNENEPASLHVHGSSIYVAETGAPAIATNPDATILPGQSANARVGRRGGSYPHAGWRAIDTGSRSLE